MAERRTYQDRRPYVRVAALGDLQGPERGLLTLPLSIAWTGRREYDLDSVGDQRVVYERVLVEAATEEDLRRLLNSAILVKLWPDLYLPDQVRARWHAKFPALQPCKSMDFSTSHLKTSTSS